MAGFATHLVAQSIPRTASGAAATTAPVRLAISPGLLPPVGLPHTTTGAVAPQDVCGPRKPLQDRADRQPTTLRMAEPSPAPDTATSHPDERELPAAVVAAPAPPTASGTRVVSGSPARPSPVFKSATQR